MTLVRTGLARVIALLGVGVLGTGCTVAIGGRARPAPGMTPHPLTGQTVKQVLLDDAALSRILHQSFKTDPHSPPRFGGPEKLQQAYGSASPAECLGVVAMMEKTVYGSANVKDVARESWWNTGEPAKVISVGEGVVALPTAADADALFAKFTQQWNQCNGTTLTQQDHKLSFTNLITDVRVADSVLAASVSVESSLSEPPLPAMPDARAIGVRVNCLVEVDVAFFITESPSDEASGDLVTSAVDIAHTMMENVSALS